MRPRKKWEPEHRFGGNKTSWYKPAPLGTTTPWKAVIKTKKGKRK